nr:hypothetical protein [Tanacetum cinerariifolium]
MDLFGLISAPNPAKVKTETRPRAAHEVSLLNATANRVIDMEDMTGVSGSSGTPSTVEKSPLYFSNEDPSPLTTERTGITVFAPATQEIPVHTEGVSDPDPLSYAKPQPAPEQDVA